MKPILIALALTAAYSLPVLAQDGPTLFKSKPCAACHSIDTKVVGPALKEVAAKKRQCPGGARRARQTHQGGYARQLGTDADAGQPRDGRRSQDPRCVGLDP
ncbi:c-type cytochrome [Pseudomonas bijieensis]|uniref:Cytochrome c-551 n=1 Tax=Pseudomonas bijieensis TaxID=2681983 RepID=A0A6N1CIN7_9PSED|nr:c-type cytochrome [Pseudomonas bijieensis]